MDQDLPKGATAIAGNGRGGNSRDLGGRAAGKPVRKDEIVLAELPDDPLVAEKASLARGRAARARLDSAREAEEEGDLDAALQRTFAAHLPDRSS